MKKIRILLAGAILAGTSLFAAQPAHAMKCADGLDEACAVVATVVCKVVAKGQPCLY